VNRLADSPWRGRKRKTERERERVCARKESMCIPLHMYSIPYTCISRTRRRTLHIATHNHTMQHTATHCNTLQHAAAHCNTLQHTATHTCVRYIYRLCICVHICRFTDKRGKITATHCNKLQHTATHCNTLRHTTIRCNTHTRNLRRVHIHIKETCNFCSTKIQ